MLAFSAEFTKKLQLFTVQMLLKSALGSLGAAVLYTFKEYTLGVSSFAS
jgi:hypothetical protein